MEILFVILFLLISHLIRSIAIDQQQGFNPYPFGTWIFSVLHHILLFVSAVFYLGWLWGIVLFLAHLFGIVDFTFTWILNLPILFIKEDKKIISIARLKQNLLFPLLIVNLIFSILSFFVSNFKALFYSLTSIPYSLAIILLVAVIFSIPRIIIMRRTSKSD